ncbi:uncharacterized protein LOC133303150 [Gastrolobium bilobum]|uniref:uncharacterized protein LOC133303150 n=1 Tax=Gastrolobium bilobum TaxID=150636 RepID=UPI002AB02DED|nr:uncharacterized protein LOC133303150 [Gastrolobium bilobum]
MAALENESITTQPKRGFLQLENNDAILAEQKLIAQQIDIMNSKFEKFQASVVQAQPVACEYCKGEHKTNECNALIRADPIQNHGGLDYKSSQYLQPPPIPQSHTSELEKTLMQLTKTSTEYIQSTDAFRSDTTIFMQDTRSAFRNQEASIRNIETQIRQLSRQVAERNQGTFPTDTIVNPSEDLEKVEASISKNEQNQEDKEEAKEQPPKELQIDIPFAEALEKMAFLKETLSKKRNLTEDEPVILTEECSAIIQKNLPPKLKDLGSFSIPCTIGKTTIEKVLCDLGASINVMPLTLMKKMGINEVKSTKMNVQLADHSIKQAHGIVEDVLVKGELIMRVDGERATFKVLTNEALLLTSQPKDQVNYIARKKFEEGNKNKIHQPYEERKPKVKIEKLKSKEKHVKTKFKVPENPPPHPHAYEYHHGRTQILSKGMVSSLSPSY